MDTGLDKGVLPARQSNGRPVRIEPDLAFIDILRKRVGDSFIQCFQCGTCSATCSLSPDLEPFPRKEMAWANWGMKDLLINDTDVWLCFQCNDCSTRCPRGARPGDVLAAVRQESVEHYSFPRFLARWVNRPQFIPLLLAIPTALLALAVYLKDPIENALGLTRTAGPEISFAYSSFMPHWLLNGFFFFFTILMIIVSIIGLRRFWKALKSSDTFSSILSPQKSIPASFLITLKKIVFHENFNLCTTSKSRLLSHVSVFFGFIGLGLVSLWVITSGINPLIHANFVYPFGFWSPWKIIANLAGISLLLGISLIIHDRLRESRMTSPGNYFDWAFIGLLLTVVLTGFFTEILHYIRLEPHRHLIYFVHLVFIFALLFYLPYSKFAHLMYRTVALVYNEHTGRIVKNTDTANKINTGGETAVAADSPEVSTDSAQVS